MSFLHPDEARECQRCRHRWRAEKWTKLDAQQPILGVGITARAQDLHRQTVHERRDRLYRAWRYCPECSSKKVKTLRGKDANSDFQSDVAMMPLHNQEQQGFSVLLVDVGPKRIKVIKALMGVTELGLKQAKELVERAPVVVFEAHESGRAKHVQRQLASAGAVTKLLEPLDESGATANDGSSSAQASRSPSSRSAPPALSVADEIEKLADLCARGILSESEYEAAKSRLLS